MTSQPDRDFANRRGNRANVEIDGLPYPVHLTFVTLRRRPFFADQGLASDVFEMFEDQAKGVVGCVLPDHVHWIRSDCVDLIREIRRLKSYSTRLAWSRGIRGRIWQRSFFDRVIRTPRDLTRAIEYVRMQPVKHGVASAPSEYPFLFVHPERCPT